MTVQRPHDADPGKHRWAAVFRSEDQRLHVPWRRGVRGAGRFRHVAGGVPQGEEGRPSGSVLGRETASPLRLSHTRRWRASTSDPSGARF